ncbi:MAG: type II secretion system protein GspK [Parerythrobacter sp.]
MHKMFLVTALAGTALALGACSQGADDAAEPVADSTVAATDAGDAMSVAGEGVLDANTATPEQLAGMDGMSTELAKAIVAGQPFASVTDLNAALLAAGTPEQATAILAKVFVPVDLNSATKEELQLIPGMTDKMLHEFEEYRPYDDMAEFDREIGKYVDEAEVARFRNYVTL